MTDEELKDLYEDYKANSITEPDYKEWDSILEKWENYREIIENPGLTLDDWLHFSPQEGSSQEGSSQEGNYNENKYTLISFINNSQNAWTKKEEDKDKTHKGFSFFAGVNVHPEHLGIWSKKEKDEDGKEIIKYFIGKKEESNLNIIKSEFEKIKTALKSVVSIDQENNTLSEVYDEIKGSAISSNDFFMAIFILEGLRNNAKDFMKDKFMWVCSGESIEKLEELVLGKTSKGENNFERNACVYKKIKEILQIKDSSEKKEQWALNHFLWSLADINLKLFIDFNNPNVIFSGAPATGKTYTVQSEIQKVRSIYKCEEQYEIEPVYSQFHPSYTYQDFIEGIKPTGFDGNGNLKLEVMNGRFKQFCIDVKTKNQEFYKNNKDKIDLENYNNWPHYYYVVDEINRGNLSNIFGETFTLLEYRDFDFSNEYKETKNCLIETSLSNLIANLPENDKANLLENDKADLPENDKDKLIYKKINGRVVFGIPFNIHFIGMMNDVDRSIDAFDLAFRRRFRWKATCCDYNVIKNDLINSGYKAEPDVNKFIDSCKRLNWYLTGEKDPNIQYPKVSPQNLGLTYQIGHGYFLKVKTLGNKTIKRNKKIELFDGYLEGTIKEYLAQDISDGKELEKRLKDAKDCFCSDEKE